MLFLLVLVLMTGLAAGSFMNVCICRLPREQSILFPPSHCPVCRRLLGPRELVPVLSYLWLKGKCSGCGAKISPRYPLVELTTGLLYLLLFITFGWQLKTLFYALLLSSLLTASLIDLDHQIIPDSISYFLILSGLLFQIFFFKDAFFSSLLGGLLGGGLLLALAVLSRGGMGGGDIKLAAGMGIYLGWQLLLVALLLSFVLGSLAGLAWVLGGKKSLKSAVPFGPFLAAGTAITVFFGPAMLEKYLSYF
ncbi:prepilin peptidase [Desulforamulus ruminis]|uniref:Prepilin leader peptidase/N-methyltransferase n=1 Tax=Desulforamulus ruminis (strain ATCC 23193 / DSM 2154 / NCIMB 8452 / DL) TaxID=696281 RepID=F6DUD9_DESRL|nr:A24 family peptidase [Desulforamulus ruminis]AEG61324.1 Prepilin peptidase [Desulforamulus ruminis DSM 2154]